MGNADAYFSTEPDDQGYRLPAPQRPRILVFEACDHVSLLDLTIEQAPMWTVHLVSCRQVVVERLTIDNDLTMANTDALDLDSCQQVRISEGAINLHSSPPGYIRDVHFHNIHLEQRQSAVPQQQGMYDIRPPCNPEKPTGMGLDNAYRVNPATGQAYGVEPYPQGMPALFACGGVNLTTEQMCWRRPDPLPAGWSNTETLILDN